MGVEINAQMNSDSSYVKAVKEWELNYQKNHKSPKIFIFQLG